MTNSADDVWRDEDRLPVRELERAVAAPAGDGEVDDMTGNDAAAEEEFGHGAEAVDRTAGRPGGPATTDPERPYRPSTTGRTGPH
ncbi:hypothetical protein [Solwaraspora sp. WMMD792]|uniref:hypothetical protein n=1 Tax=unclassified Solwaraspora TaxID=2627926 RepID=UPI002416B31B|nr:hypothetical protein [Solwaraspora sp. WMMD792]MDG4770409.1 hypothetical protein [Solwaraspora sp. WMMD792]